MEEPSDWLESLIENGYFGAAEVYVKRLSDDLERIYALLILADVYHDRGIEKQSSSCASRAVTLWKLNCEKWWSLPMLGDLLRKIVECGQSELAEQVIEESVSLVKCAGHAWVETHGWCGLAQGLASMNQRVKAESYLKRASQVANSRSTSEERESARSIVEMAIMAIGDT